MANLCFYLKTPTKNKEERKQNIMIQNKTMKQAMTILYNTINF